MKPLTIALTGTHGCGKTTLTNALVDRLHLEPINISRPTSAAQQLGYEKAADVPQNQVSLFQWMGLFEQIHQERLRLERPEMSVERMHITDMAEPRYNPGYVSDRSTIDFLAYYRYRVPMYERLIEYQQLVEAYARKYSLILYLPPNPNGVVDDNRRFTEGTEEIDRNIQNILGEFSLTNATTIAWAPVEERVEMVVKHLQILGLLDA